MTLSNPPHPIDRADDTYESGWRDGQAALLVGRRGRDEALIDYTAKRLLGHCAVSRADIEAIIAAAEQAET